MEFSIKVVSLNQFSSNIRYLMKLLLSRIHFVVCGCVKGGRTSKVVLLLARFHEDKPTAEKASDSQFK